MVYVAFLRAINVGGRGVVRMDALRDAFTDAGCTNVQSVIASGNVQGPRRRHPDESGSFLGATPERMPRLPLRSGKDAVEAFAMTGLDVFIVSRPKKGPVYGFPNGVIEQAFRVAATTRNWNTVKRIVGAS